MMGFSLCTSTWTRLMITLWYFATKSPVRYFIRSLPAGSRFSYVLRKPVLVIVGALAQPPSRVLTSRANVRMPMIRAIWRLLWIARGGPCC
jgi:hypothetical protein